MMITSTDEMYNKYGINLSEVLKAGVNETNKVNVFIQARVDELIDFCSDMSLYPLKTSNLIKWIIANESDYRHEELKKAVEEQILYVITNGDILGFSGVQQTAQGIFIADKKAMNRQAISPKAISALHRAGVLYCGS